jgi:hypothetical protein
MKANVDSLLDRRKVVLRSGGVTREAWVAGAMGQPAAKVRALAAEEFGVGVEELEAMAFDETDDAVVIRPFATWG